MVFPVFGVILMIASIATTTLDANTRRKRSLPGNSNGESGDPLGGLGDTLGGLGGSGGGFDWVTVLLSAMTFMDAYDCGQRLVCEMAALQTDDHEWAEIFRYVLHNFHGYFHGLFLQRMHRCVNKILNLIAYKLPHSVLCSKNAFFLTYSLCEHNLIKNKDLIATCSFWVYIQLLINISCK